MLQGRKHRKTISLIMTTKRALFELNDNI